MTTGTDMRGDHSQGASHVVSEAAAPLSKRAAFWRRTLTDLAIMTVIGLFSAVAVLLALVGPSGALSWWAPVQPVVGLAAVGLLLYTLRKRLQTYDLVACPVPAA